MRIGTGELLIILCVALVVFGPSRLPELGKILGQTVRELRQAVNQWEEEEKDN